jgi:hypothetical protein
MAGRASRHRSGDARRRTKLKICEGGRECQTNRARHANRQAIVDSNTEGVLGGPEAVGAGEMADDAVGSRVGITVLNVVGEAVRRYIVRNDHRRRARIAMVRGITVQQEVQRRPGCSEDQEHGRRQAPRPHAE